MDNTSDKKDTSSTYALASYNPSDRSSGSLRFPVRYHGRQNVPQAPPTVPCGCRIVTIRESSLYCGPHSEPVAAIVLSDGEERIFPYDKFLNCPCYQALNGKLDLPEKPLYRDPIPLSLHNCRTCVWCRNTRHLTSSSPAEEPQNNSNSATEVRKTSTPARHSKRPSLILQSFSDTVKEKGLESPEAQALLTDLILHAESRSESPVPIQASEDAELSLVPKDVTTVANNPTKLEPPDNYFPVSEPIPPDILTKENPRTSPGSEVIKFDGKPRHPSNDKPTPQDSQGPNSFTFPGSPQTIPGHKRSHVHYRGKQAKPKRQGRRGVVLSGEGVALN